MCTGFRNAALLAKMAATLDHVSDGRLILGVGAGWHDPEYEAFGSPTDHKVSRFEEALAVITGLIRDRARRPRRPYVTAQDAVLRPPARPELPILVASKMPRMLELTARHADSWNLAWFGLPDERLARIRGELAEACTRRPRPGHARHHRRHHRPLPGAGPPRPRGPALTGTPAGGRRRSRGHAAAGADHVIAVLEPTTPETLAAFAEAAALYRASTSA